MLRGLLIMAVVAAGGVSSANVAFTRPSGKPTICSITINSEDEIEAFKAAVGESHAHFVELTRLPEPGGNKPGAVSEGQTGRSGWLRRACRAGIRCDVMVISGHFGGSFFGSSGINLPIEELERNSCDAGCDGILQAPKEVFLFGCNTLAGKTRDHRTPDQYRRVLIEDGFSTQEAEQVVAFRYSPLGSSFNERMRRIFRGVKRIYGFDSVAPSGERIKPKLEKYLKIAVPRKYYSSENLSRLGTEQNMTLISALSGTAIAQVAGAADLRREDVPVCYLENDKVPLTLKLRWIEKSLNTDDASFQALPAINEFLTKLENYRWPDKEWEIVESVTYNRALRERLEAVVKARDSAMLGMQLKILTFMKFFGWVHKRDYFARAQDLLLGDLAQDFSIERRDQICSYAESNALKVDLDVAEVPTARWQDPEFLSALGCIATFKSSLQSQLLKTYLAAPVDSVVYAAAKKSLARLIVPVAEREHHFAELGVNGTRSLSRHLTDLLCARQSSESRPLLNLPPNQSIGALPLGDPAYVKDLGCYVQPTPDLYAALVGLVVRGNTPAMKAAAAEALRRMDHMTLISIPKAAAQDLVDIGASDDEHGLRLNALELLAKVGPHDGVLLERVLKILESQLRNEQYDALSALTPWGAVFTKEPQAKARLCAWSVEVGERLLKEKKGASLVRLLDAFTLDCKAPIQAAGLNLKALKLLAALGAEAEVFNHVGNPVDFVTALAVEKPQLTAWKELWALLKVNDQTFVRRKGTAVDPLELAKLASGERFDEQLASQFLRSPPKTREMALHVLVYHKISNLKVVLELADLLRNPGQLGEGNDVVRALQRQDEAKLIETYALLLPRAKSKALRNDVLGYMSLFDSPAKLLPPVMAFIQARKVPDDYAAMIIERIGQSWTQIPALREGLRAALEKPLSAKVKEEIRKALHQLDSNEYEMEIDRQNQADQN